MQDYTLKELKVSDYKDDFGNVWCDAIFEEYGEPAKWVLKDPMSVREGVKYFGHVEIKTSKAGKPYNRFYRDKAPEGQPASAQASSWTESPEKQQSINRAVALNGAVAYVPYLKKHEIDVTQEVLDVANKFYAWLQNETPLTDPFAKDIAVGDIPEYDESDM